MEDRFGGGQPCARATQTRVAWGRGWGVRIGTEQKPGAWGAGWGGGSRRLLGAVFISCGHGNSSSLTRCLKATLSHGPAGQTPKSEGLVGRFRGRTRPDPCLFPFRGGGGRPQASARGPASWHLSFPASRVLKPPSISNSDPPAFFSLKRTLPIISVHLKILRPIASAKLLLSCEIRGFQDSEYGLLFRGVGGSLCCRFRAWPSSPVGAALATVHSSPGERGPPDCGPSACSR